MCKMESFIVLKDRIYKSTKSNSHTQMLNELGIDDIKENQYKKFVRVEVSPIDGDVFGSDIKGWKYKEDQDRLPDWYVREAEEPKVREQLELYTKDRFGKYNNQKQLNKLNVGNTFMIGIIEYIVLDKFDEGISCITTNFINENMMFDNNSGKFDNSYMNKYLNIKYYNWLSNQVGADNIVKHEVDLTTCKGEKDFGTYQCNVSLLTVDQYNKYKYLLPSVENWWWLATPYSVDPNYARGVCYVNGDGDVYYYGCCYFNDGVRPFCIFKSSILVSCE